MPSRTPSFSRRSTFPPATHLQTLCPTGAPPVTLQFSQCGHFLAAALQHGPIHVFSIAPSTPGSAAPPLYPNPTRVLAGHTADVLSLAFGPPTLLASAAMDRTVRLWAPANSPACLRVLPHRDMATAVAFVVLPPPSSQQQSPSAAFYASQYSPYYYHQQQQQQQQKQQEEQQHGNQQQRNAQSPAQSRDTVGLSVTSAASSTLTAAATTTIDMLHHHQSDTPLLSSSIIDEFARRHAPPTSFEMDNIPGYFGQPGAPFIEVGTGNDVSRPSTASNARNDGGENANENWNENENDDGSGSGARPKTLLLSACCDGVARAWNPKDGALHASVNAGHVLTSVHMVAAQTAALATYDGRLLAWPMPRADAAPGPTPPSVLHPLHEDADPSDKTSSKRSMWPIPPLLPYRRRRHGQRHRRRHRQRGAGAGASGDGARGEAADGEEGGGRSTTTTTRRRRALAVAVAPGSTAALTPSSAPVNHASNYYNSNNQRNSGSDDGATATSNSTTTTATSVAQAHTATTVHSTKTRPYTYMHRQQQYPNTHRSHRHHGSLYHGAYLHDETVAVTVADDIVTILRDGVPAGRAWLTMEPGGTSRRAAASALLTRSKRAGAGSSAVRAACTAVSDDGAVAVVGAAPRGIRITDLRDARSGRVTAAAVQVLGRGVEACCASIAPIVARRRCGRAGLAADRNVMVAVGGDDGSLTIFQQRLPEEARP